ncbi:MAG TPA: TIGR03435 family protein, partial [Candidatus Eisenbacteria bacterium]|nr:TIGR03435 family protein [Candidatus Eisenbacteria bacterium]
YAESILKVCEFCLGSPLPCVAGVTGADLKKRMVHIMNDRILHKLDFARKFLLTAAAFLAIAVPITFGVFHATPSRAQSPAASAAAPATVFSSLSVKPSEAPINGLHKLMFNVTDGSFVAEGATLQQLIQMAYRVQDAQISGPADLLNKPRFDIEGKLDPSFVAAMRQQGSENKPLEGQAMLRSLLASQFKLAAHFETRNLPVYDLLVDENGSKLQKIDGVHIMHMERGQLTTSGTSMDLLAVQLSQRLGQTVIDKTGLKGSYAFDLHWTPDASEEQRLAESGEGNRSVTTVRATNPSQDQAAKLQAEQAARTHQFDPNAPSLFVALQQQLGLKLEPQTEPVQVLVIDHVELPSAN